MRPYSKDSIGELVNREKRQMIVQKEDEKKKEEGEKIFTSKHCEMPDFISPKNGFKKSNDLENGHGSGLETGRNTPISPWFIHNKSQPRNYQWGGGALNTWAKVGLETFSLICSGLGLLDAHTADPETETGFPWGLSETTQPRASRLQASRVCA